MRYQVLKKIKAKTPQGEMEILAEQIIEMPAKKAAIHVKKGIITPIERRAYKVYSEILNCCLWVVPDVQARDILRADRIQEAIYTQPEVAGLLKADKETLKATHKIKQIFPDAEVKDVKKRDKC